MSVTPVSQLLAVGGASGRAIATRGGRPLSLSALRAEVAVLARQLRAGGVRRGMLAVQDGYLAAVGLLGLLYAGAAVVVPQNLQPQGLGTTRWDRLLTDRPLALAAAAPAGRLLALGEDAGRSDDPGPLPPLNSARCRIEFFTAGSTGLPKVVLKTLAQMEQEAQMVDGLLNRFVAPAAPVLGTVPLHHLYGLTFRLFWPLTTGRLLEAEAYEFWESLATDLPPGAALITSPAHLTRLVPPDQGLPPLLRPSLVLSAGAPLSQDAAAVALQALATPVTEIYGSTETGVVAWRRRDLAAPAWTAFTEIEVRASPERRLAVRSPLVRPSDAGSDGWFETADLVRLEGAQGFHLLGRADSIVKIEGKRVSLPELEQRLAADPLVAEAALLLIDEAKPTLGAVVVLSEAGRAELSAMGAFRLGRLLRGRLVQAQDASGLPRRWRFVPALPSGVLGKRRRADLLALFELPPTAPTEPVLRALRRLADGVELDLYIQPALAQLQGHFPGLPIVPGVAQVDWAVTFAGRHLHLPLVAAQTFQVKFRRIIGAGAEVTLTLRHLEARRRVEFSWRAGSEIHSQGSLSLDGPR